MALQSFVDSLKELGVGRRSLNNPIFQDDKPLPRYGIFDLDDEILCHKIIKTSCHVPGCKFITETLLEFENHYNASHRYSCSQCKKVMPSPHLLDLHIQETHDSFFAVLSAKKPSYTCYNEDCKDKFMTSNERLAHCVQVHKLPKDFRFDQSLKTKVKGKQKKEQSKVDSATLESSVNIEKERPLNQKPLLKNSKQKTFSKYTGKKFTNNECNAKNSINIDAAMSDIKGHLPI